MTFAADVVGRVIGGMDVPIFTGLALIVAVALYEPLSVRIRAITADGPRDLARQQLLRALGESTFTTQPAAASIEPALERLAEALGVAGIELVGPAGEPIATTGVPDAPVRRASIETGGEALGELRIGAPRRGRQLGPGDEELIGRTATFVATALRTGRREEHQLESLARLSEERADVEQQALALHAAFVRHSSRVRGLTVFALGPLRVGRGGEVIERWGGDKAGSRQAEGLFAFLFDRGERGVAKDEVLELIWPDVDLERAISPSTGRWSGCARPSSRRASGGAGR